ncbi:hypothetical protein E2C01_027072 [Portunus trituberculatus]|uniref:Uncharacterized protein n=1 Tax=Portunus trituberculatus TaxID=210409 RepID=A0A5B7EKZ5_PORTR|nr:hypothetical protein [Portunus trituberculatus]
MELNRLQGGRYGPVIVMYELDDDAGLRVVMARMVEIEVGLVKGQHGSNGKAHPVERDQPDQGNTAGRQDWCSS